MTWKGYWFVHQSLGITCTVGGFSRGRAAVGDMARCLQKANACERNSVNEDKGANGKGKTCGLGEVNYSTTQ